MNTDIIQEIINGNELIARFMGWHDEVLQSFTPPNNRTYFCSPGGQERVVISFPLIEDDLKYHSSWDWLMPVVEKIKEIDNQAHVSLASKLKKADLQIFRTSILCHKEAVYERVIEFIEWYINYVKE